MFCLQESLLYYKWILGRIHVLLAILFQIEASHDAASVLLHSSMHCPTPYQIAAALLQSCYTPTSDCHTPV